MSRSQADKECQAWHFSGANWKHYPDSFKYFEIYKHAVSAYEVDSQTTLTTLFKNNTQPIIRQGDLADQDLEKWLERSGPFEIPPGPVDSDLVGGLRLIYAQVPHSSEDPFHICVDQSAFQRISEALNLPLRWPQFISHGSTWSSIETAGDGHRHLTFLHESLNLDFCPHSAISANLDSCISTAFFFWASNQEHGAFTECLIRECTVSHHYISHPMFLPLSVVNLCARGVAQQLSNVIVGCNDFDREILSPGKERLEGFAYSGPKNHIDINNRACMYGYAVNSPLPDIAQHMSKCLLDVFETLSTSQTSAKYDLAVSKNLRREAELLQIAIQILKDDFQSQRNTINMQITLLNTRIAQQGTKLSYSVALDSRRIAAESKRDSSAMKTIAVLTIVFLPGTFVATLFNMGMFNFQSSPDKIILSRYFWLYWVIAIPLTLFVMAVWFLWYRRQEKRGKKQMQEEEEGLENDDWSENLSDDSIGGDKGSESGVGIRLHRVNGQLKGMVEKLGSRSKDLKGNLFRRRTRKSGQLAV